MSDDTLRVLVVEGRFYSDLSDELLRGATSTLEAHGVQYDVVSVPGALEIPAVVALVKGKVEADTPTLVRMHQVDFAADMLGHIDARRDYIPSAMKAVQAHDGAGVVVFIRDPNPHWLSERYGAGNAAGAQFRSNALRDYGVGAQILLDLGVREMVLLTSSQFKPAAMEGYGLRIVGWRDMDGEDQA